MFQPSTMPAPAKARGENTTLFHDRRRVANYQVFRDEGVDVSDASSGSIEAPNDAAEAAAPAEGMHQLNISVPETSNRTATRKKLMSLLRTVVEHLGFRILSMLLIVADIIVLAVDTSTTHENQKEYNIATVCFACFFVVEIGLRISAQGPKDFFGSWLNLVDFIAVCLSFIAAVIHVTIEICGCFRLVVLGRLVRLVSLVRLYTGAKKVTRGVQQVWSKNRRRYQEDGFDLDLTYITDRIIAMSCPSSGVKTLYGNPIKEVRRLFDTKHKGHCRIYNMCSEETYGDAQFGERIERITVDIHNVPRLRDAVESVRDAQKYLADNPQNVVAVHSKLGTGRTGTMICMLLLVVNDELKSAEDSLDYFANARTDKTRGSKLQGIKTPSQRRYVKYFEEVKDRHGGELPPEVKLTVTCLRIHGMSGVGAGTGKDFSCEVFAGRNSLFKMDFGPPTNCQANYCKNTGLLEVIPTNFPPVQGDIKFCFRCTTPSVPCGYEDCPFYFWFHTSFIKENRLYLQRDALDNPHKPETWNVFCEDFAVELLFSSSARS